MEPANIIYDETKNFVGKEKTLNMTLGKEIASSEYFREQGNRYLLRIYKE